MTQRHQILQCIRDSRKRLSAYQIAQALDLGHASVSTTLKRMADEGVVKRTNGLGPRGGFVYQLTKKGKEHLSRLEVRVTPSLPSTIT